ncbi:MAG TPA: macro domain-containing protein [Longimicrobiales bacterium]|nr:macro domain-containing protein [Longimicrobiales bacterium]
MIRILDAELADTDAEAVLRPVTAEWTAPTLQMRRLEMIAGAEPDVQCRRLGELPVGSAIITPAGDLAADFMIHVIIRSVEEPVTEAGVRRALQNGMRRVVEWGIRSIAMPPLGTGAGNLDAEDSAALMIPLLEDHLGAHDVPERVDIHVETEYEREIFQRWVDQRPTIGGGGT